MHLEGVWEMNNLSWVCCILYQMLLVYWLLEMHSSLCCVPTLQLDVPDSCGSVAELRKRSNPPMSHLLQPPPLCPSKLAYNRILSVFERYLAIVTSMSKIGS